MSNIIVNCPHCNDYIIIEQLNCGIFRHAILIDNYIQLNPHSKYSEIPFNKIYGCGKPFKISIINNVYVVDVCDYNS